MKEQRIKVVKIIHGELSYGEYRFLADFFRLTGCFVCDCIASEEKGNTDYDVVIIVDRGEVHEKIDRIKTRYSQVIIVSKLELEKEDIKEQKDYLMKLLEEIQVQLYFGEEGDDIKQLKTVAEIYVEQELMKTRNSYVYLYDEKDVVKREQKKLLRAFANLNDYMKTVEEPSQFLIYFEMDLMRSINETCDFLSQIPVFDVEKMMDGLMEAQKEYSFVSNMYILQGMIAESQKRLERDAAEWYKRGIEAVGEYPYASYGYYRLGRVCERRNNWNEAIKYYKKSCEINSREYRSWYKIAVLAAKEESGIDEAVEAYGKICDILKKKEQNNYLQEKEYEYLYKAYFRMAELYAQSGQKNLAVENYEKVIALNKRLSDSNLMYEQIYGKNAAEEFKNYTKKRLKLYRVYKELVKLYRALEDTDRENEALAEVKKIEEESTQDEGRENITEGCRNGK